MLQGSESGHVRQHRREGCWCVRWWCVRWWCVRLYDEDETEGQEHTRLLSSIPYHPARDFVAYLACDSCNSNVGETLTFRHLWHWWKRYKSLRQRGTLHFRPCDTALLQGVSVAVLGHLDFADHGIKSSSTAANHRRRETGIGWPVPAG